MQVLSGTQSLRVDFGGEFSECRADSEGAALQIKIPLLAGAASSPLLEGGTVTTAGIFHIADSPSGRAGIATIGVSGSLEDPAFRLYRELLEHVGDRQIYRVWNYVPRINSKHGALENYRAFNIGRHRAFEERFGDRCSDHMAPASAVGIDDGRLAVAFIAGEPALENVENPEQTPAYRYPLEHGPKSPSFTRGAYGTAGGRTLAYLSGTSSIKEHRSIGERQLGAQFGTTIDNIRIVLGRMGFGDALDGGGDAGREFTFYLRRPDDLGAARELFRSIVGADGIAATRFLHAEICREELLLEIEGIFWRR